MLRDWSSRAGNLPRLLTIDPKGRCEPAEIAFARVFGPGAASPMADPAGYLCRNRGYVQFIIGEHLSECRLRPLMTSAAAYAAARDLVATVATPVVLNLWLKGWLAESYASGAAAALRLEAVENHALPGERPDEAILSAPQPVDELLKDDAHPFKPLLLRWRIASSRLKPDLMTWLATRNLTDRLTIAEINGDRPLGVIRYLGPKITAFGPDYPFRAPGTPVEELPSRDYGTWAGQSYKRIAESEAPHAEHVDALIAEPGGVTRRSRYERLLLPFIDPAGRKLVMTLSQLNPNIAIPFYL